jgi:hypothetical protein
MTLVAKVHRMDIAGVIEIVVALADSEIVGKNLGGYFFINPRFYMGKELDEKQVEGILENATIINAVGEKSVQKLISMKLAEKDNVAKIEGVPHAQVVVMRD